MPHDAFNTFPLDVDLEKIETTPRSSFFVRFRVGGVVSAVVSLMGATSQRLTTGGALSLEGLLQEFAVPSEIAVAFLKMNR